MKPFLFASVVTLCCSLQAVAQPNLLNNGDFEADAIVGPGQSIVGPNESKWLVIDTSHPTYGESIKGIPSWINSFTDVGFGAGFRDAGLRRIDVDGSGDAQYAFINNWETRLSQVTGNVLNAGQMYAASVDVALSGASQAARIQLWAGEPSIDDPDIFPATAVLLADVSVADDSWNGYVPDLRIPLNDWTTVSLNYTVPDAGPMLGQPLTLSLLTSLSSAGPPLFDNAVLRQVPEPATGALLLSVAPLFIALRRNRHS